MGRIVEIAPTHKLYTQALHPYTQALLAASPVPDPMISRTVQPLEGDLPSPANPPSGCVFRTRCPLAEAQCAQADMTLREHSEGHWQACWRNF